MRTINGERVVGWLPEVACDLWATDSMIQGNLVKSRTAMEHVIFPSFNGDE